MIYWRIKFIDGPRSGTFGYLIFDANMTAPRIADDDGNTVTDVISYTTIETGVAAPAWA